MKRKYLGKLLPALALLVGITGSAYGGFEYGKIVVEQPKFYYVEVQNKDSMADVSIAQWLELVELFEGKDVFAAGETFRVPGLKPEECAEFVTKWADLAFELEKWPEISFTPSWEEGFTGEFLYESTDGSIFQVNMIVCARDYCDFEAHVTLDDFQEDYYGFCKVTFTKIDDVEDSGSADPAGDSGSADPAGDSGSADPAGDSGSTEAI